MRLDAPHDGALGHRRPRGVEVGQWPAAHLLRGEVVLALTRELAATLRDAIRRRLSSLFPGGEIHLSSISPTWLQTHESEYDKRQTEP